jgi:hypothetical protein
MGVNGLAQVQGSPGEGVTGIVIVIVGVVRVKGKVKVKGSHMVVRQACGCVWRWRTEADLG